MDKWSETINSLGLKLEQHKGSDRFTLMKSDAERIHKTLCDMYCEVKKPDEAADFRKAVNTAMDANFELVCRCKGEPSICPKCRIYLALKDL